MTIYHVFANRSNIGDWLSARGIQKLLAPLPVTELLCDDPFVPDTCKQLSAAGASDLVVVGGGGLFMDYFEPFWQGFLEVSRRVPFCIWGAGFCDMKLAQSRPTSQLVGTIASRARVCVVRDTLTRDYLTDFVRAEVVPCPTLNVVESAPPGRGLLHVDAFDNVGESVFEQMNDVGARFAGQTGRPFRRTNNLIPTGRQAALDGLLELYAAADLILASRLHACIIGLAMGRKVLAVSGDYKVEAFMNAAGLGEWVLGLDQIDLLADRLAALPGQSAPAAFLERARAGNRDVGESIQALSRRMGDPTASA